MPPTVPDDGIPYHVIDGVILWTLPVFLGWVGYKAADEWHILMGCAGIVLGITIARGVQAATRTG
jgi:hypothetical protein